MMNSISNPLKENYRDTNNQKVSRNVQQRKIKKKRSKPSATLRKETQLVDSEKQGNGGYRLNGSNYASVSNTACRNEISEKELELLELRSRTMQEISRLRSTIRKQDIQLVEKDQQVRKLQLDLQEERCRATSSSVTNNASVNALRDRVQNMMNEVGKLKQEVRSSEQRRTRTLHEHTKELKSKEGVISRYHREVQLLKTQLQTVNMKSQGTLESEIRWRERANALQADLANMKFSNQVLESKVQGCAAREHDLKQSLEIAKKDAQRFNDLSLEKDTSIKELESRLMKSRERNNAIEERLLQLEAVVTRYNVVTTAPEKPKSSSPISTKEESTNKAELKEKENEIMMLKNQLQSKDHQITSLNQNVRNMKSMLENVEQKRLSDMDTSNQAQQEEQLKVVELTEQLENVAQVRNAAEWARVEAEERAENAIQQANESNKKLSNMQQGMEELVNEIQSMKSSLETLSKDKVEADATINTLNEQLKTANANQRLWRNDSDIPASPEEVANALGKLYRSMKSILPRVSKLCQLLRSRLNGETPPMSLLLGGGEEEDPLLKRDSEHSPFSESLRLHDVPTLEECADITNQAMDHVQLIAAIKTDICDLYAESVGDECHVQ